VASTDENDKRTTRQSSREKAELRTQKRDTQSQEGRAENTKTRHTKPGRQCREDKAEMMTEPKRQREIPHKKRLWEDRVEKTGFLQPYF
jgi:hypothetical protein